MISCKSLFLCFFKIGTFTIGGGYAMIPQMEEEIVHRHSWIGREEFLDLISISQAMPGVFAVNMAVSVGLRLRGWKGAVSSVVGNVAMPILMILLLAVFFGAMRGNVVVDRIFMGIRPAVVALIAAPVFRMAVTAKVGWSNFWIPLCALLFIWLLGVNPVFVILVAALGGFLYGRIRKDGER